MTKLRELELKIFYGDHSNAEWWEIYRDVTTALTLSGEKERQEFFDSGAGELLEQVMEYIQEPAMCDHITVYQKEKGHFTVRNYYEHEKLNLIKYMESFEPYAVAGKIDDCVTGKRLSAENCGFRDGNFVWSIQDIYHIKCYNAAVTDEFLSRALSLCDSKMLTYLHCRHGWDG